MRTGSCTLTPTPEVLCLIKVLAGLHILVMTVEVKVYGSTGTSSNDTSEFWELICNFDVNIMEKWQAGHKRRTVGCNRRAGRSPRLPGL